MKKNIKTIVGGKIKKYRAAKAFTQQKLAETAEIDYKYLQRIEGKNPPNLKIETIEKLSSALKVKITDLFD